MGDSLARAPAASRSERVCETPRHRWVLAFLPDRDDHELAARLVLHADEHEVAVAHVHAAAARPERDAAGVPPGGHARRDLAARVERAAHPLAIALDGVVRDRYEGHRSRSSPTVSRSGRSATRRTASSTPGMKLVRSVVTWRIVSVWATSPRITSWSATMPGRRTEWIGTSPSISCAVRAAVPEGASSLAGWWYSTISARCMKRDASAAKRIMSTAPRAKFGA